MRISVYCGSRDGNDESYSRVARELGQKLAEAGIGIVYGGAQIGLMGALADSAMSAGGEVIGVIPEKLTGLERGHKGLTELQVVKDMHVRKQRMMDLSDASITLPGGTGTLEEFFEVWTWNQLGYHSNLSGILNVNGYYDTLLQFINDALATGFISDTAMESVIVETTVDTLLQRLL